MKYGKLHIIPPPITHLLEAIDSLVTKGLLTESAASRKRHDLGLARGLFIARSNSRTSKKVRRVKMSKYKTEVMDSQMKQVFDYIEPNS